MKPLTCKQASEALSRRHEQPLTFVERFWLKLHLCLCNGCRNFQNNVQLMRAAMQRYLDQDQDRK